MKALLILNLQNDFMPWGTVPVEGSDQLAKAINEIMDDYDEVIAVQDWHPADHVSFAANHLWWKPGQTLPNDGNPVLLWTMHCVKDSFGAELNQDLNDKKITKLVRKGIDQTQESFSAFQSADTDLRAYLKEKNVEQVFLCGLITEFDIKNTAFDAKSMGFHTSVLVNLCKGLDLTEKDSENALLDISRQGISLDIS